MGNGEWTYYWVIDAAHRLLGRKRDDGITRDELEARVDELLAAEERATAQFDQVIHGTKLKRDENGNEYPAISCIGLDIDNQRAAGLRTAGDSRRVTCCDCLRADKDEAWRLLKEMGAVMRKHGMPDGITPLGWLDAQLAKAKTDGPTYNAGRTEGHADVAADLRKAIGPVVAKYSLDGLISYVKQLASNPPMRVPANLPVRFAGVLTDGQTLTPKWVVGDDKEQGKSAVLLAVQEEEKRKAQAAAAKRAYENEAWGPSDEDRLCADVEPTR